MKRKLTLTLVLMTAMLFVPATASAQEPLRYNQFDTLFKLNLINQTNTFTFEQPKPKVEPVVVKPVEPKKPDPVVYTVIAGDNLTKIGTAYNVEWQRLWAKNTQLTHPDRIDIGDKITIPEPSEQLTREIPAAVALPTATPGVAPRISFDGSNTYDYGYCTWYVKNRRGASLPNSLGNANTWYSRAAAAGMAVGSVPRPGAVGTTTAGSLGHVVYVESVNADGSINISEMNYKGWGIQSSRTTSASEFVYIY
jgi:surface antigen